MMNLNPASSNEGYAETARKLTVLQEMFKTPAVLHLSHANCELLNNAQANLWRKGFTMTVDRLDITDPGLTISVYPQGCPGDGWSYYVLRSTYLDVLLQALTTI